MTTLLLTHPSSFNHLNPPGHPERPDRLRAIAAALEEPRFQTLKRIEAPSVPLETIALCHPMDYVEAVREASPKEGLVRLDADTSMSPGSFEAAVRAVGGAVHAVDEVVAGNAENAFCSMRPPGHHTETARPMGFCIFNQAAIAARHAQRKHGLGRVAVVDFDVHHGNGTQEIFWSDATVMYCSTHEMPLYPGTGAASERGDHDNIVNAPLRAGDAGDKFKQAFESRILPRLSSFGAELIIISAGFDAHRRDPLANLQLVDADFAWATQKLMEVADKTAQGRVVSVLEGGYDLEGLAQSAAAHVAALMRG
jgi:acetoin utilization deacetylase AcuC-like enzyme